LNLVLKINYFALAVACFQITASSQTVPYPDEGPAAYVVRVISLDAAQRDAFVACLAKNDLPFWRGLRDQGSLKTVSVFETTTVESSEPGVPAWNFVISTQVALDARPDSFVGTIQKRKSCEAAPGVELRRMETLRTTPNSNYARSTAVVDAKVRESKVDYHIEYIKVNDTPESLNRYREIMSSSIGPGWGPRIRDGAALSLLATETVKVHFSQSGMPNWNQIHFTLRNQDRPANPGNGGRGGTPGYDLDSIRTRPRIDRARQLFDLAVR
jgi:hypothetical protein